MAGRISFLYLAFLVNPDSDDLTRCAEGNIHGNGNSNGCGLMDIRREPSEQRWDAGKSTRGCNNETPIASLYA
jgi:hypothetical protein